jgi:hypothetical protein
MKKLGIIQPGKIGDIIICLPIAKWYSDKGYKVIWPIDKNIISNFIDYVDYVEFISIDFDCKIAHQICFNNFCSKVIDLSFTIPGANNFNTENYLKQDVYSFDEFKYFLADVPFEEKWNLRITRNPIKEKQLEESYNINEPFVIIQENSSDCIRKIEWGNNDIKRIDITNISDSIFDWLILLEKSEQNILIESCFTNLVDQLNISSKKNICLLKNGYYGTKLKDERLRGIPILKIDWNYL